MWWSGRVSHLCVSSVEFPTPKTDLQHSFHVLYLGMTSVLRPIGNTHTHTHSCHLHRQITIGFGVILYICNCADYNVLLKRCVSGMDMINGAIDSLMSSAGKEDWTPVLLNVADATITVIKEKVTLSTSIFLLLHCVSALKQLNQRPQTSRLYSPVWH